MAISLKSITTAAVSSTAATFTCTTSESPSATQVGDLVIVLHSNDFYALTNMSTPAATGSPTMNSIGSVDGGTNQGHTKAWWYVANTAGAQTITATETGTHDEEKTLAVLVLGGADTASPIDGTPQTAFNTATFATHPVPSVTVANSDSYLIAIDTSGGGTSTASYTASAPLVNQAYAGTPAAFSIEVMTAQLNASGATGTINVTPATSVDYYILAFAVKTAGGGGGGSGPDANQNSPFYFPGWRRSFYLGR